MGEQVGRSTAALCATAVGLVALGLYLATLSPGLTWAHDSADGGELAAAARTLGIPHPPGYPTYVLLAHLFTWLPLGEVATRTNLFSALCAALTAALLAWALARTGARPSAALAAGLALAASPLLWSQATVTEVHALNGLFTAALLAAACVGAARCPLGVGLLWGLSLGNHLTALFCAPLALLALGRPRRAWLWGALGLALGLTVYLYLPLRAAADPPVNWGDPRTLERFEWMVSGGPYRGFVFALPPTHLPARLLSWAGLLTETFGWPGLLVIVLGGCGLSFSATHCPNGRGLLGATAVVLVLDSAFAIGYDTSDSYLYLLPALVCLALWLGWGTDWLLGALTARQRWAGWAALALALVLPLIAMGVRFPALDLSDDRTGSEFAARVLDPAPLQAVILSERDEQTFALWYFQYALDRRSDVVTVDTGLLGYDWYVAQLARRLGVPLPVEALQAGARQAATALERPVCAILPDGELSCVEP